MKLFGRMPKGWIFLWLVLCLSLLALLGGCERLPWSKLSSGRECLQFELPEVPATSLVTGSESESVRQGLLYFTDCEKRFLVPVYRPIPFSETIIRDTLEQLLPSPGAAGELASRGLQFVLPEGLAILGIAVNEGLARVDFSAPILSYTPEEERLVLGSLLCTLRQFPEIERLQILVEGMEIEQFPGGTSGQVPLGPECWINLEIEEGLTDYRNYCAVTVYFCYYSPGGEILYVPVTRILSPDEEPETAAFRELLAGPAPGSGLFSEIPPGTTLEQLGRQEALLNLELSEQLTGYRGGVTGAKNITYQLLLTAGALPGVEQVQVLINGQPVTVPGELDFQVPQAVPGLVNCF